MIGMTIIALVLSQNALDGNLQRGSGGALDSSLQHGTRSNAPSARPDYRSRNLVVTGDVAGGRGFRGSVGYTAADDFRGATSGDTTRAFRAESSTTSASSLASTPVSDRFGLATGIGATAYRRDFSGTGTGALPGAVTGGNTSARVDSARAGWDSGLVTQTSRVAANDSRVQMDSLMRQSSIGADFSSMYQPTTVTVTRDRTQRSARIIASPFRGIVSVPNSDLIESLSLGVYGSALLRSDLRSGRANGNKMLRSYLSGMVDEPSRAAASGAMQTGARLDGQIPSSAIGATAPLVPQDGGIRKIAEIRTPYDRVLNSVGNRYRESQGEKVAADAALDASALRSMGQVIQGIRDQFQMNPAEPVDETERLLGSRSSKTPQGQAAATQQPSDATPPESGGAAGTAAGSAETAGTDAAKSSGAASTPPKDGNTKAARRLTGDEAYLLMAHGQTMSQLDGGTKEALDTMLQSGDASMRSKHYLTAERAFMSGTLIAPSNPLPVAGLANSQVAAGLQISASTTLRRLFMTWPEMIDTRYGLDILGSADRLREVGNESLAKSVGSKYATDYGLVAAFVGHQLGDSTLTERGIAIMALDPNEQILTEALRVIWLRPALVPPSTPVTGEARPSK